jgi:protein subunit release factor A
MYHHRKSTVMVGASVPIIDITYRYGGVEADQWVADLSRILAQYAEHRGWLVREHERVGGACGGARRVVLGVQGAEADRAFRWMHGTHRAQRVDGRSARVRTATATVAVLPLDPPEEAPGPRHDHDQALAAKIRTYNYQQDRVTDHRILVTLYGLDRLVDAHLDHLAELLELSDARGPGA